MFTNPESLTRSDASKEELGWRGEPIRGPHFKFQCWKRVDSTSKTGIWLVACNYSWVLSYRLVAIFIPEKRPPACAMLQGSHHHTAGRVVCPLPGDEPIQALNPDQRGYIVHHYTIQDMVQSGTHQPDNGLNAGQIKRESDATYGGPNIP